MFRLIRDMLAHVFNPHHDKVQILDQVKVQSDDVARIAVLEQRRAEAQERHEKPFLSQTIVKRVEPHSYLLDQLDKASAEALARKAKRRAAVPNLDDRRAQK